MFGVYHCPLYQLWYKTVEIILEAEVVSFSLHITEDLTFKAYLHSLQLELS